jgi:metal-responsive CopG/Arc/MetJ family transcriptional regulator
MQEFADDNTLALIIKKCRKEMKEIYTKDKMTVCINLTQGILRIFCIQGKKEDILELVDEIYDSLKNEVEDMYKDND